MAAKTYLRPNEIEEAKQNLRECDESLAGRAFDQRVQHSNIAQTRAQIQKRLEQAPPDLSPDQKTKLSKQVKTLEDEIKIGMLSHEEMRRNPPGAVAQNRNWQRANRDRIRNWKNAQLALMKGASQEDVSAALNVARLRPSSSQLNMDNAQIPRATAYSFPTEAYKAGWDQIDWHRSDPFKSGAQDVLEEQRSEE